MVKSRVSKQSLYQSALELMYANVM